MTENEEIARMFHETYEQLAPLFGYKTRDASAVPWEEVPDSSRKLMVATVAVVSSQIAIEAKPPQCEHRWELKMQDFMTDSGTTGQGLLCNVCRDCGFSEMV